MAGAELTGAGSCAAEGEQEAARGVELLHAEVRDFPDVDVAGGVDGDAAALKAELARPSACEPLLAARFFGAGLEAGGGGMAVGAGAGFEFGGGAAAGERFGAVRGDELGDVFGAEGALEGDHVDVGGGAAGLAGDRFDADRAAAGRDIGERVEGRLDFGRGGVEGEAGGFRDAGAAGAEAELEGARRCPHPDFLGLVDRTGGDVPAEGLDEAAPGGELLDPVVACVQDVDVAGDGIGGDAFGHPQLAGGGAFAAEAGQFFGVGDAGGGVGERRRGKGK